MSQVHCSRQRAAILNRMFSVDLIEEVTLEERLEL